MCELKSTSANYKASTNTSQNNTNTQNKILNGQTEQYCRKADIKAVLGENPYTLKPGNKSLIETDVQLSVQLPLLMALAAEAHLAEGQLRRLKST
jgi:dUTPase